VTSSRGKLRATACHPTREEAKLGFYLDKELQIMIGVLVGEDVFLSLVHRQQGFFDQLQI
jgi:hypothetical protein